MNKCGPYILAGNVGTLFIFSCLILTPGDILQAQSDLVEPNVPAVLSLDTTWDLVMTSNASLEVANRDIRMAQADQRQAGLWPNPELSVEIEGIGGTGPWSGFNGAETTIAISQPIETAGKVSKRRRIAETRTRQAEHGYVSQRRHTHAQATKAFYAVLAAQQALDLAQQNMTAAENLSQAVSQRVAGGKDSPIKQTQAAITVSEQRMAVAEAEVRLSAARQNLAALWGSTEPKFAKVTGNFDQIAKLPTPEQVLARIDEHPAALQWQAVVAEAQADLALAKADPVPDITLVGGYKRLEDVGQNTAVIGLALPLPVYHRNQGSKERATLALGRTRRLQRQAEVTLITTLKIRYQCLTNAAAQATELRDEILPRAEQAYTASVTAYEQGKFDYLEILDAQRTLFETKQRTLDALESYHKAKADLEALVGPLKTDGRKS
ncbi:TolC family protein [Planctomycetota bacterium]